MVIEKLQYILKYVVFNEYLRLHKILKLDIKKSNTEQFAIRLSFNSSLRLIFSQSITGFQTFVKNVLKIQKN